MPHARLVSYVFTKLFCWGVPGCSRSIQLWQEGSVGWSLVGPGHTPLRLHLMTVRSSIIAIMFSAVISLCCLSICTIVGVSSVSCGCSEVILAGCTTGASVLAWAVHAILKNFQRSIFCRGRPHCRRDLGLKNSYIGILGSYVSETSVILGRLLEL